MRTLSAYVISFVIIIKGIVQIIFVKMANMYIIYVVLYMLYVLN